MPEEKSKKEDSRERIEELIKNVKETGEKVRKEMKDREGLVIKAAAASLSPLPPEMRKHIVASHKEVVEAVKIGIEDYLDAINNLLKELP